MQVHNNSDLVWWQLKDDQTPSDENLFLQMLQKCLSGEVAKDELKTRSMHILKTKAPTTQVGEEAKKLQETLYQKFPDIFNVITIQIGTESRALSLGALEKLDAHFVKNFSHSMKEAEKGKIIVQMPPDVDCAADFVAFIDKGRCSISLDNVIQLLQLAVDANISSLGEACVDYIANNWPFDDDLEGAKELLEYTVERATNCPYLGRLYCIYFRWIGQVRFNQNMNEFVKSLPESHIMRSMFTHSTSITVSLVQGGMQLRVGSGADLQSLSKLFGIYVVDLTIQSNQAKSAGTFPNLKKLELCDCNFSNSWLEELSLSCKNSLKELIIKDCLKLTGFGTSVFSQLETVTAKDSQLTSEGIVEMSHSCPKLKRLDIAQSKKVSTLEKADFPELEELNMYLVRCMPPSGPKLKKLTLGYGGMVWESPSLPLLEELHLLHAKFQQAHYTQLAERSKHIKKLTFEQSELDNAQPEQFILPELEELTLRSCKAYEPASFVAICNASRGNCKKLTLTCIDFYFEGEAVSLRECDLTQLTELTIKQCKRRGECTFCKESELRNALDFTGVELPHLRSLDVANCTLSNEDMQSISRTAKDSLETIKLYNTKLQELDHWDFSCLKEVTLKKCRIIDRDIQKLSQISQHSLTTLTLDTCYGITSFSGCTFPNVNELSVVKTNLTQEGRESVHIAFPRVTQNRFSRNRY